MCTSIRYVPAVYWHTQLARGGYSYVMGLQHGLAGAPLVLNDTGNCSRGEIHEN